MQTVSAFHAGRGDDLRDLQVLSRLAKHNSIFEYGAGLAHGSRFNNSARLSRNSKGYPHPYVTGNAHHALA